MDADIGRKRVVVELYALNTVRMRRRLVIDMPAGCDDSELRRTSGIDLDSWSSAITSSNDWEYVDGEDFEVEEAFHIEDGVPEFLDSDLVFQRDENGQLVIEGSGSSGAAAKNWNIVWMPRSVGGDCISSIDADLELESEEQSSEGDD